MTFTSSTFLVASLFFIVACTDSGTESQNPQPDGSMQPGTTRAPFGAACFDPSDCASNLCSFINGTSYDAHSLDPDTSLNDASGMCTVACDFNTDCPPPGSNADPLAYWCNDHFGGVTATNPDGRYCVHRR